MSNQLLLNEILFENIDIIKDVYVLVKPRKKTTKINNLYLKLFIIPGNKIPLAKTSIVLKNDPPRESGTGDVARAFSTINSSAWLQINQIDND